MSQSDELVKTAGEAIWQTLYSEIMEICNEIIYSPLNILLLAVAILVAYKIVRHRFAAAKPNGRDDQSPDLPKLRRDFTTEDLRDYDGNGQDGRILIAVNGYVYDVKKERRFFGSGGLCASLAGCDATRNFITISTKMKLEYGQIDMMLNPLEIEMIKGWELEFKKNFHQVGKLLRSGDRKNDTDRDINRVIASKVRAEILKKRSTI